MLGALRRFASPSLSTLRLLTTAPRADAGVLDAFIEPPLKEGEKRTAGGRV